MECAIFLLAFCAFQTVFGDEQFREKLEKLRDTSMNQMQQIVNLLGDQVENAIDDGLQDGLNSGMRHECWQEYWKLHQYHQNSFGRYAHCFWKALSETDMKFAEDCFADNIRLLEGEERKCRADAKACIAKYYHLAGKEEYPPIQL